MTDSPQLSLPFAKPIWVENDGGRADAGFRGETRDCVTRSIAIATGVSYRVVYDELFARAKALAATGRCKVARYLRKKDASPRTGVHRKVYEAYLLDLGWTWVPTMQIGQGCTVHLRANELPSGIIIARLSKHLCVVRDGVIHDMFDPSREGTRCVYGYFQKAS